MRHHSGQFITFTSELIIFTENGTSGRWQVEVATKHHAQQRIWVS